MPDYEALLFNPPAPVAWVALRDPDAGTIASDVPLPIDTGADVTLLPQAAIQALGVSPLADLRYELVGFDGSKSFASVVLIDMIFLQRVFRGRYLLTEDERGIMGRDILNHIALLLDGPRRQWSEQAP
jgi:hypothetical protein